MRPVGIVKSKGLWLCIWLIRVLYQSCVPLHVYDECGIAGNLSGIVSWVKDLLSVFNPITHGLAHSYHFGDSLEAEQGNVCEEYCDYCP